MNRDEILKCLMRHTAQCDLCPRACGVNRNNGETGACGASGKPCVYQHFVHLGEEVSIVPAFIVNLAHCNLNCPHCPERFRWASAGISVGDPAQYAAAMARYFKKREMPESIEWIGGEPSLEIRFVVETSWALKDLIDDCPPIYLNTNGYFNPDLIDCMDGAIDGFVFDLKSCRDCARDLCGAHDYWDIVTRNILNAYSRTGAEYMIIRHLVVPGHVECCTRTVIDWCRKFTPDATINVMTTYKSFDENGNCAGSLDPGEAETACNYARQAGFENLMVNGEYA